MSAIKDLLDEVAVELGIMDPNDPAVIQETERRLLENTLEDGPGQVSKNT